MIQIIASLINVIIIFWLFSFSKKKLSLVVRAVLVFCVAIIARLFLNNFNMNELVADLISTGIATVIIYLFLLKVEKKNIK